MEELISIIIPVYNVELYICECLESVINQTYKKLEIIIIDDGSTDKSAEICKNYLKKDNRIRLISQKNSGVSAARNLGIEFANGEYITFIDSDDYIDVNYIKCMYENIKKNKCDIVVCGLQDFEYNNKFTKKSKKFKKILNCNDFFAEMFREKFLYAVVWAKLYKKDLIKGLKFDSKYKIGEDLDFLVTNFLNKIDSIYVDNSECLYYHRVRNDSATESKFNENWLLECQLCKEIMEKCNKINDKYLQSMALRRYIRINLFCLQLVRNDKKLINEKQLFEGNIKKYFFSVLVNYKIDVKIKLKMMYFMIR